MQNHLEDLKDLESFPRSKLNLWHNGKLKTTIENRDRVLPIELSVGITLALSFSHPLPEP